jgi:hypothetical protein
MLLHFLKLLNLMYGQIIASLLCSFILADSILLIKDFPLGIFFFITYSNFLFLGCTAYFSFEKYLAD